MGRFFPAAQTRSSARGRAMRSQFRSRSGSSLSARQASKSVREHLASLKKLGAGPARVEVLGPVVESAIECRCRRPSSYILYAYFLSIESPVRCGDCFGPVALYRLPPSTPAPEISATYRDFLVVLGNVPALRFALHDFGCWREIRAEAVGRCEGNRLSKMGRGVAESLERKRVERPVYYFLIRISETTTERKRRCPSCRGAWLLKEPWHGKIDFRCRKCRLISNVAWGMR